MLRQAFLLLGPMKDSVGALKSVVTSHGATERKEVFWYLYTEYSKHVKTYSVLKLRSRLKVEKLRTT